MVDRLLETHCVLLLAAFLRLQRLKGLVDLTAQEVLLAVDQLCAVWSKINMYG